MNNKQGTACHGMVVLSFRKVEKCCFTDPDPKSGVQWVGKGIVVSKIASQVSGFGFDLSNLLVSS